MTIVVVDDDSGVCLSLVRMLTYYGFETQAYLSADAFLESGRVSDTDCLVLDVRMPGRTGLDLQTQLRAERRKIPIIFITGYMDDEVREQALKGGAIDILEKPFDNQVLIEKIKEAVIHRS